MKVFCIVRSRIKPNCDMSVLLLPYKLNYPSLFLNSECFSKKCIWCITDFVPLLMFPFPASHYIAGRAKGMAPTTFFCGASFECQPECLHTSTALSLSVLKVAWREVKSPQPFAVSPQSTSKFSFSSRSPWLYCKLTAICPNWRKYLSIRNTHPSASVSVPAKVVSEPSVLSQLHLNVRMLCFHCHPSNRCNSQLSGQLQDAEFKVKVGNCPREPPREIWMYLGQQPRRNLTVQQTKRRTVEPRRHYIMQIVLGGR